MPIYLICYKGCETGDEVQYTSKTVRSCLTCLTVKRIIPVGFGWAGKAVRDVQKKWYRGTSATLGRACDHAHS